MEKMAAFCRMLSMDCPDPPPAGQGNPVLYWRPYLSEPYAGSWQNEWPMEVYESVVQLMRELDEENMPLIEQRFKRIRRDYFQLKDTPRRTYAGVSGEYERAFNKVYYSK